MGHINPVIIIGGGSSNGLGIARNLGSQDIDVFCITSNRNERTIFSKYCKGFSIISGIEGDPDKLRSFLIAFSKRLQSKGVLFPTNDTALLTVSSIRHELEDYVTYIPDREIIETCVIKKYFYKSLVKHDVPHPTTIYPGEEDFEGVRRQIAFPVFIRPSQSLIFHERFGGKGFVATNTKELRKYIRRAESHHVDVVVQEVIPGPTRNGYALRGYFDKKSRPIVLMATQKIRQPSMFSNSTTMVSIPLSQVSEFASILVQYLTSIQYQGLFFAEFKQDERDGVFKLLEINARSGGGNYISKAAGVNDVLLAYRNALGEDMEPMREYETGIYYIDLAGDIPVVLSMVRRGQFSNEELRPYMKKKIWHCLSKDDPLPFLNTTRHLPVTRWLRIFRILLLSN